MRAKIVWARPEDGGRSEPPLGVSSPSYATLVKLEGSNEPWPASEAWSLTVEKIRGSRFAWEPEVRFLADEAPSHLLTPGRSFELYEGHKRVAVGVLQ